MNSYFQLIFGSLLFTITIYYERNKLEDLNKFYPENPENFLLPENQIYDFIVVGGGAAGCMVASKLTEENFNVLLLEEGANPPPQYEVPAFYNGYINEHPAYIKFYKSTPKSPDGISYYAQVGKGLGGGSSVNGMIYNRGHKNDYDNWALMTNDSVWNYDNIIQIYKSIEDCQDQNCHDEYGKTPGKIGLQNHEQVLLETEKEWLKTWHLAGEQLGFETELDPNMPQREGFANHMTNKRNGRRESVYKVFLEPLLSKENLVVSKFSIVKKIEFDENKRAVGVHYEKHGRNLYARASKEIIISAGAFGSPLLLLKSGIGPEEQLLKNNIPLIQNLPVGQSFQEHPNIFSLKLNLDKDNYLMEDFGQKYVDQFLEFGTGPLANPQGNFAQAFIISEYSKNNGEADWPDIQLDFIFDTFPYFQGHPLKIFIGGVLERPFGYGKVELNTENNDELIWTPDNLDIERDLEIMAEAGRWVQKVVETPAFAARGLTINKTQIEPCKEFEWESDEYWKCLAKNSASGSLHPTSTCPMGLAGSERAVVDSRLKVFGVSGLRVMDSSVFPRITNANPHPPSILVGEMGARFIIQDWSNNKIY